MLGSVRRVRFRGGRCLIAGAVACLIGLPVAFAVAGAPGDQTVTGPPVPASECAAEVNAVWREAGLPRDGYSPGCPSLEEARTQATYFNGLRREGLTTIAGAIRERGDAEDAPTLAAIERELEQLGGDSGE